MKTPTTKNTAKNVKSTPNTRTRPAAEVDAVVPPVTAPDPAKARGGDTTTPEREVANPASKDATKSSPQKGPRTSKAGNAKPPVRPSKTPRASKSMSALDAAALVIAEAKKPMRATDLIKQMETRKLWISPGGKTPEATLYAAIIREIAAKGRQARFAKHDRGLFVARTSTAA